VPAGRNVGRKVGRKDGTRFVDAVRVDMRAGRHWVEVGMWVLVEMGQRQERPGDFEQRGELTCPP
jgi:hypothetical protein